MTRDEAVAYVSARYSDYLDAASREATDAAGKTLTVVIDDALRALGYASADIPTAEPTDADAEDDYRLQLAFRTMRQVDRDLGATSIDISVDGDSFKLSQLKAGSKEELALLTAEMLERFGTLGVVPGVGSNPFVTLDLNYLDDAWCEVTAWH